MQCMVYVELKWTRNVAFGSDSMKIRWLGMRKAVRLSSVGYYDSYGYYESLDCACVPDVVAVNIYLGSLCIFLAQELQIHRFARIWCDLLKNSHIL